MTAPRTASVHRSRPVVGLLAALAVGLGAAIAPAGAAPAAPAAPATPATTSYDEPRVAVRRPSGPLPVSTRVLHLVDRDRPDPWRPDTGARELMVTMTYPARGGGRGPATYSTRAESRAFLRLQAQQGAPLPDDLRRDVLSRVRVPATRGARPSLTPGGRPLVVLSPGFSLSRSSLTGLATELASRGYVVASVDHTYESAGISLPGGRLARCAACDVEDVAVVPPGRAEDVSFVLDRLLAPRSTWRRVVDEDRIGMAGHSIGGNSTATTMAADERIDAGANLDGTFFDPVSEDLDRPFLLMGTRALHTPTGDDETWPAAWRHLTGPRTWVSVEDSTHFSFLDYPDLVDQLGLPASSGLEGRRALRITRAYVGAFFDRHLRGRPGALLDGPSARFPEVAFHGTGRP